MTEETQIRVLIVDDIPSTLDTLQRLMAFESDIEVVGTASNGEEATRATRELRPDVVLMDVNMPVMDGIRATEQLVREMPGSPVIIMSVQGERDYLRRAMQAGAREFLIKPFSGDELVASIRRVYQLERKKEAFQSRVAEVDSAPDAAADNSEPGLSPAGEDLDSAPVVEAPIGPQVITVFSGKGGVGKSLVASNLAASLASETGSRVALLDLDLQFGDLGVMLNLDAAHSIMEAVEAGAGADADYLDDVMAVGPNGIRVLLAPASPELADLVTAEHVRNLIDILRQRYQFIVIDTSAHLGEIALEAIEQADRLLLLTSLELPAIKEAKLTIKILESLSVAREKLVVVLNRAEPHADFSAANVENTLRSSIAVQIPSDSKLATASIHRGVPVVSMSPESDISQKVRELVGMLVPGGVAAGQVARGQKKRLFWAKAVSV